MLTPLSNVVEVVRSRLVSGQVTAAMFQAALSDVPPRDRDRWVDDLWDIDETPDDTNLPRGCVPYLRCPVATILNAIDQAEVTSTDVFVDIGGGSGRTAFLVHALTGASCIGIEIQADLVKSAIGRAKSLRLDRIRFIEGDAVERVRSVSNGTVFFLYCPFSGDRLHRFLDELERIAHLRRLRVCCVHLAPLERSWLEPKPSSCAELHVYQSLHFSG